MHPASGRTHSSAFAIRRTHGEACTTQHRVRCMHGEEQSASEMYRSMRGQRAGRSWPTACLALLGWSRSVRCAARRADGASSPRLMVAAFGSLARQGGPTARTVRCAARRGRMRAEALSCSPAATPLAGGHHCRQHAWLQARSTRGCCVASSPAARSSKDLLKAVLNVCALDVYHTAQECIIDTLFRNFMVTLATSWLLTRLFQAKVTMKLRTLEGARGSCSNGRSR